MSLQVWLPLIKDYENYGLSGLKFANFRYIRFVVNAIKGGSDVFTQLSRLEFIDANGSLYKYPVGTTVSSSMTGYSSAESPASIIDGNVNTKFCAPWGAGGYLTIALGSSETIDISRYSRFQWYTANDCDWRDPISFEVQFSNDGVNFVKGAVVTNASITSSRYTLAYTGNCFNAGSGKIGSSCYYNNSHSSGGLVSDKTINLGNKLSMCCWVKFSTLLPDSALGGSMGGQHRYPNNTGMGLTIKYISSTTGYLSCNTGDGSNRTYNAYCGSTLLSANTWYHVAFTYDGSTIKFYVNGNLDGTHSYTGQVNVEDYVFIGAWSFEYSNSSSTIYGSYKLHGYMNDFRIYDHVITEKDIDKIINPLLMAHYQLKDASGVDVSGNRNNLTKVGTINTVNDSIRYNSCVDFNNTGYLKSDNFGLQTTQFTVAFWVNPPATANSQHFLFGTHNNWTGNGFSGWRETTNVMYNVLIKSDAESSHAGLAFYPTANQWNHIAYVYTGTELIHYKDGVEQSRITYGNNGIVQHPAMYLGNSTYNGAPTSEIDEACMSDFRFYATALPANDIFNLYQNSASLKKDGTLYAYEFAEGDSAGVSKGGTVSSGGFSDKATPTHDMKVKALPDGSTWARVHHLDVTNDKTFFANASEVAKCTDKNNRYSRMVSIDKYWSKTLPYEYTRLEYIESNGTQYIDSGFIPNQDTRVYAECVLPISTGSTQGLFGSRLSSSSSQQYQFVTQGGFYRTDYYNKIVSISSTSYGTNKFFIDKNKNVTNLNGDLTHTHEYGTFTCPGNMYIFATNNNGSVYARSTMKLYTMQIYDNDTLIRDFVPCKNASGIAGLFDIVNGKFYTSNGDGEFIAGTGCTYEFMLTYPSMRKTVPSGYTALEYIKATGTQQINTKVTGNARWEFDMQFGGEPEALIPTMTSNTAPFGTAAIYGSYNSGQEWRAYYAFDSNHNTNGDVWYGIAYGLDTKVGYIFPSMQHNIRKVLLNAYVDGGGSLSSGVIEYTSDGSTWKTLVTLTSSNFVNNRATVHEVNIDKIIGIRAGATSTSNGLGIIIRELQVYGDPIYRRQLMGYSGNGQTYWGIQSHGGYGVHEDGTLVGVQAGKRDTIVHNFGENGDYSIWVQNKSVNVIASDVSSFEYKLFDIYDGTSDLFKCVAKLYRCKCIQNGTLIRDFVPAMRNSDGYVGLYDVVNNAFYGNSGSGNFIAGHKGGYQWLDYIQSSGTQYIDTGFKPNNNTRIVVKASLSTPHSIYGVNYSGASFNITGNDNGMYFYWAGNGNTAITNYYNQVHVFEQDKNICRVDGNLYHTYTNSTWQAPCNMFLFGRNNGTALNDSGTCRIYSCQIYDNGTLIRDYVPCINAAHEAGMYDKLNNKFYGNSGSGNFIEGGTLLPLYNRWIQTSSPNTTSVSGFKPISTSWTAHNCGIRKHGTSCIYNCDSGGTWYAPIGQTAIWEGGIPAADGTMQSETELWIRTDRLPATTDKLSVFDKFITAKDYIEL